MNSGYWIVVYILIRGNTRALEGMEQGEIEYFGTEAAEDAVGEAVVDGDAVREEEEDTL